MRIPRKKELLELQRKYRTDKKIGQVYGVPARLVAYWRSKKKIGLHSFPKYTEEKIQELWERFGDDVKAGAELGISKAAFRQWRRRYNINQKPAHFRLEQLELELVDPSRRRVSRRETIIQKILAKKSGLKKVEVGQIINAEPDITLAHDNAEAVIRQFREIGAGKVWNPARIAIVLNSQSTTISNKLAVSRRKVREFVKKHRIRNFYDVGEGICNQVLLENGHVLPGNLVLGADDHATSYGCIAAFGAGISPEELACIWAVGRIWLRVPATLKVVIEGKLARGVYAKDIILKLMRDLAGERTSYKAMEFHGSVVSSMSLSDRFTMTNLATEIGAKTALVSFDDVTARYLRKITKARVAAVAPDPDAIYDDIIEMDISYLTPQVACCHKKNLVRPLEEVAGKKMDQVVLGSCSNGRIEDLEIAARILGGRRINREVRMLVIPGSRRIYSEALDRGILKAFLDSGCVVGNPGCGPCLGGRNGLLAPGERALSTAHPNCGGEACDDGTEVFIASPATAAATALEGAIADPRRYLR